jgi:hypothetical protein
VSRWTVYDNTDILEAADVLQRAGSHTFNEVADMFGFSEFVARRLWREARGKPRKLGRPKRIDHTDEVNKKFAELEATIKQKGLPNA